ncbi:MAG: 3-hydroxyacyl-ACP dehydratase FabZ [Pseudomonadota bacterium]|nr:3-hydroxyacyl-ACP dehydratase FabZ [Pseudomonadota bacterium]
MNIHEILKVLPHRYPFLMIDRVLECDPGVRVVALKNVTYNEPCFMGHFPGTPVFPGVLIVEAMAQACGIVAMTAHPEMGNKVVYLAALDGFRFRKPVIPGDALRITVEKLAAKRSIWKFSAKVEVEGKLVAEGEVMATVADPPTS